ncbi:MAG: SDR family oxidoreductase [Verrucomicrobia subdivision 3 bacterium]|nr:SDR family oxidoreductase [Limisphaerales bacterium]
MPIYPELKGRIVLVTGGANGIGAAIVGAFREQGSAVYFCDTDAATGRTVAAKTGSAYRRVDLRKEDQIKNWIASVGREQGHIDLLVNNAASDPRIALERLSAEKWDNLFAVNLRATFLCSREAVPRMNAGSAIVNLASITWHLAPPRMSAYVATKAGVLGLTRSLARELGPKGIRVNAVSPGWVMTERQLRQYVTPAVRRLIRKSQCIPDLIQPEEIAEVVLFLASDASCAITGQEILADRGWQHS